MILNIINRVKSAQPPFNKLKLAYANDIPGQPVATSPLYVIVELIKVNSDMLEVKPPFGL